MRLETCSRSSAMLVVFAVASLGLPLIVIAQDTARSEASETMRLGLRGVYFVSNQGQWSDAGMHYGLRSRGLDVAFRDSGFSMYTSRGLDIEASAAPEHLTLTVSFPGSNDVEPVGARPQTAKFNYFVGGEGRGVASDVPSFAEVAYENIYDGIDLHVMGDDDGVLKYEFHVAPGADYSQIRIAYEGIESLCIDDGGNLRIKTSLGTLRDSAPEVWQETVYIRTSIPARFELEDDHTYRIGLDGAVDLTRPLIIDPEIEWMYYLGGAGDDWGSGIAVDGADHSLVTGRTNSSNFVGRNNSQLGEYDAYVAKIDPSGQVVWMTYLGGSEDDMGENICVDGAGNALVTGRTYSIDFGGQNNSFHGGDNDAFVLKVSPSGQLLWMTHLGGSDWDAGWAIDADREGSALICGRTYSFDFDGRLNAYEGGLHDGFVLKVNSSGQLQWMRYVGGNREDEGTGIAIDDTGHSLMTGTTRSVNFTGSNNAYHGGLSDGFVLKIDPVGQLLWMTYFGSVGRETGLGIAVDSARNALPTGVTDSRDFAGRNNDYHGGGSDGFVLKVSPAGQLLWMTYVGGGLVDEGIDIAVDQADDVVVTGFTRSGGFAGANNSHHGGVEDAFALKVRSTGQLQWSTYLGGGGSDGGISIVLDGAGHALVTGLTTSLAFEGHRNSYYGGLQDAFLVKLRLPEDPVLSVDATCPGGGAVRISWEHATPNGRVAVIFARDLGTYRIPPQFPCAGAQLGLGANQIHVVFQGGAGTGGSRTITSNASAGACGGFMQLLDVSTCRTSNVVRIE